MNAATKAWTKHGGWTSYGGPWYRHASGRIAVSGEHGTVGDNVRGWRKTKFYQVVEIAQHGTARVRSFCSLAAAKAYAERAVEQGVQS